MLRALVERGVVVSLGHSLATAAQATAAVDAGARWVTHLFNAMAPLHHREPGLAGVALTDERLHVGLIADGIHVHPTAVALAQRALGPRLTLVTDAVAALGRTDAPAPGGVRLADGTLAGSDLPMDQAHAEPRGLLGLLLRRCRDRWFRRTRRRPRRRPDRGRLRPGDRADLVLLTPDLHVVATWVAGTHGARHR